MAKAKVGILHSGTSGKHDAQIAALKNKIDKNAADVVPELYGNDTAKTIHDHTDDLINNQQVDVFVAAGGTACAEEAKNQAAGKSVKVVFTSADDSFVPLPNMTGVYAHTSALDPTRLCLLHELLPAENTVGVLRGPRSTQSDLTRMAKVLNVALDEPGVINDPADFDQAFKNWKKGSINAVIVTANSFFNDYQQELLNAATIPAIYQWHEFVESGGLISYGPKLTEAYELAGTLVNSIVNADPKAKVPPVVSLTSFELFINKRTAKGISIPDTLLARADKIIV
jgi:ABC-type uncharacterized transport system substrate-binding protein